MRTSASLIAFQKTGDAMQCPKCAYIRQQTDKCPDYECPQCGIIYAKYNPAQVTTRKKQLESEGKGLNQGIIYSVLAVMTVAAVGWLVEWRYSLAIVLVALSVLIVRKAIAGSRLEQERKKKEFEAAAPYHHCLSCGNDFKYQQKAQRGSTTMEIALWVLILWPVALVYTIWRRLGSGKAQVKCLVCASSQVIPADSPAAKAHKKSLGING